MDASTRPVPSATTTMASSLVEGRVRTSGSVGRKAAAGAERSCAVTSARRAASSRSWLPAKPAAITAWMAAESTATTASTTASPKTVMRVRSDTASPLQDVANSAHGVQ